VSRVQVPAGPPLFELPQWEFLNWNVLHGLDPDTPKGCAVRHASGMLQGNLLFKTCFDRCSFGPAEGRFKSRLTPQQINLTKVRSFCWNELAGIFTGHTWCTGGEVPYVHSCYYTFMDMPLSERRQIENEMIFRRANEKVADDLDELDAKFIEDDLPELIQDDDLLLHFMCECSDEDCVEQIPIKLSVYKKIHQDRSAFIIKHDHQVKGIEKVILTADKYSVVEKNKSTAEPDNTLNATSVNNT
jgi:hypothetical protein